MDDVCDMLTPILPPADLTDELRGLLANGANPQMVRTLGHQPEAFITWYQGFRSIIRSGVVDPHVKETARLRIATLNNCQFCMHMRAKGTDGQPLLNDEDAAAAQHGNRDHVTFTDAHHAALTMAEQMFTDPAGASDDLITTVRAEFGDAGVVELGLAIAQFIGMGKVFKFLHLPAPVADL
jgi:alkylhydroperoxidase family enzyme